MASVDSLPSKRTNAVQKYEELPGLAQFNQDSGDEEVRVVSSRRQVSNHHVVIPHVDTVLEEIVDDPRAS